MRLSKLRLKIKERNVRFQNEQESIYNNLLKQESELAMNLSDLKSEESNVRSDCFRNNYRELLKQLPQVILEPILEHKKTRNMHVT